MIIHLLQRSGRETVPVLDGIADRECVSIPGLDGTTKLGGEAGPILDGTASTWSSSRAMFWTMLSVRGAAGPDQDGTARLLDRLLYILVHSFEGEYPCQCWTVPPVRIISCVWRVVPV